MSWRQKSVEALQISALSAFNELLVRLSERDAVAFKLRWL
jgi:hypothetical protein